MTEIVSPQKVRGAELRIAAHLLAGPVLYSLYFILGYLLVEAGCATAFLDSPLFGLNAEVAVTLALTTITGLILLVETVVVLRRWLRYRHAEESEHEMRKPFIWMGSFLMNVLFLVMTLVTGASTLMLDPCTWV